jgi:hypothetical protein
VAMGSSMLTGAMLLGVLSALKGKYSFCKRMSQGVAVGPALSRYLNSGISHAFNIESRTY